MLGPPLLVILLQPVRWTAPEAIANNKYSSASDVWSFAITVVEIMQDGGLPYRGISNPAVMEMVAEGGGYQTHAQPSNCSDLVYVVLLRCWATDPATRPDFVTLAEDFRLLHAGSSLPSSSTLPEPHAPLDRAGNTEPDPAHRNDHAMAHVRTLADQRTQRAEAGRAAPQQARPHAAVTGMLPRHASVIHPRHPLPSGITNATYTVPETRELPNNAADHYAIPDSHAALPSETMNATYTIPETQEPPTAAADHYAIPDSHTTNETPYGGVGRIDSSEQHLGRKIITQIPLPLLTCAHHDGNAVAAALPHPYGTPHPLTHTRAADPEDLGSSSEHVVHGAAVLTTHGSSPSAGRTQPGWASARRTHGVDLASGQDLPPSRNTSRSSLVNVKEGLYAIKPSIYEPVGEAQPASRREANIFRWNHLDGVGHSGRQVPAVDEAGSKSMLAASHDGQSHPAVHSDQRGAAGEFAENTVCSAAIETERMIHIHSQQPSHTAFAEANDPTSQLDSTMDHEERPFRLSSFREPSGVMDESLKPIRHVSNV